MRVTIEQRHCRNTADHPAHEHGLGGQYGYHHRPGRHTPSLHRAPMASPAVPSDPFAGIDENTEYDATRPGVS